MMELSEAAEKNVSNLKLFRVKQKHKKKKFLIKNF